MENAIICALREGVTDKRRFVYRARDLLGARRLTGKLRDNLLVEAKSSASGVFSLSRRANAS